MALKPIGIPNREAHLSEVLTRANSVILPRSLSEHAEPLKFESGAFLRVGVDLGTAYLVLVVLDEMGIPQAGEWQFAQVVRDGLVVDFVGAVDMLRGMKTRLEGRLGRELTRAATAYPPGVANIILHHIRGWNVPSITLVGGTCAFQGMPQVIQEYTGIPTNLPANPLFVTPIGIASYDQTL